MSTLTKLSNLAIVITMIVMGAFSAVAQNLTAAQMNIYFGLPKKATVTNSQGTITTEFDREGKIQSVTQGNMRMVYNWTNDDKSLTISMYQGQDMQDSGRIIISDFTKSRYEYTVGEMIKATVIFKSNGAIDKAIMTNPQMTGTMTYFYHSTQDIYPYAIEQSMGEQSIKISVRIDKTDSYGNAVEYTQEVMGMKDSTRVTIEYY